eukprot:CAMPEP_0202857330 /NCGR_PEP_ID=MMETSP1391-20130828/321_1 /ASSEMBLY_ACC=CAM_ASM_000867 /TAXON_ID=1034604 /ORGANISM="Chlamydomonas leiostraca, Strain SAG 11-49" /LENGTH=81 /DNA_ID=CAMNT_0049536121 /DNA_START=93 /DNA_END=334 /DNA_ORIENTATION=+
MAFTREDASKAIDTVIAETRDASKLEELGELQEQIDLLSDETLAKVKLSWPPQTIVGFLRKKVAKAVAAAAAAQPPAAQPG